MSAINIHPSIVLLMFDGGGQGIASSLHLFQLSMCNTEKLERAWGRGWGGGGGNIIIIYDINVVLGPVVFE